jgi:hypothetical protein
MRSSADKEVAMYLQGNLQAVFDALYHMGVIDPVLKKDWKKELEHMENNPNTFFEILAVANAHQDDVNGLMTHLGQFDEKSLTYLAMEVAREYADYHSREALH